MVGCSKVLDLRNLLAERFPQSVIARNSRIRTGVIPLDQIGGLPTGAITELTAPQPGAGSASLISALLDRAYLDRAFLALIDGRDSFDPQPLGLERLRHLLWVRCASALQAIKAADLLLRDGNFRLVVLDLVLNAADELRRIPQTTWYRLQRLVESSSAALLVLTHRSLIGSAQWKLRLDNRWMLVDIDREYAPQRFIIDIERVHGARMEFTQAG